jgi:hypothetical protein
MQQSIVSFPHDRSGMRSRLEDTMNNSVVRQAQQQLGTLGRLQILARSFTRISSLRLAGMVTH